MKRIIDFSKYKYTYLFYFLSIFLIGFIYGIINYSNSYSYIFEIVSYGEKFEYLFSNNYRYFFNSTYSIQNSVLYSLLLLLMPENKEMFLLILNIIVSATLYILFAYAIFKKNKSYFLSIGLFVLIFNICFNDFRYLGIETKLVFIGFVLFYYINTIKNKYLRYALFLINIMLNYSILYLLFFVVKIALSFIKNRKEVEVFDLFMSIILLIFSIIFIDIKINVSFLNLTKIVLNSFNYNSINFSDGFKNVIPLVILFLMIVNYAFGLYKSGEKWDVILHFILFIFILFFIMFTMGDNVNACYDLKAYIIFVFIDLLFLDYSLFINSNSLNLYNNDEFNFDLCRILFPFLLICLTLGAFSLRKDYEEDFFYKIKYDAYYDFSEKRFIYDEYFDNVDFDIIEKFNLCEKYSLPENQSLQTFYSDEEIFIYGFGPKEDSNGSRWTRKYAALNLYAVENDDLYINLYNPSDHYNLGISVYINNVCYYSGKTKEGSETIVISSAIKHDGNHIIRIVCDDLNGNELNNDQYGFYITNIVFTH